jgi:Glycosyl hydrolases family 16
MTTRNNSLLVARSRQPMHVRMGTCELSVMVTTQNSIASATESRMAPPADPPLRARSRRPRGLTPRRQARYRPRVWSDDFDGDDLDPAVWVPHYLPAWSSRAATAASYDVSDSRLTLRIPRDHGLWCPDEHDGPLRVSGVMSGHHSGPVGSTTGQQPIRAGQVVREEQPELRGHLVSSAGGRPATVAVRCAMTVSPRSMAAVWLVGWEAVPEESAEICMVEIFGRSVSEQDCEVGMGLHAFRDPDVPEDFAAPRLLLDPADVHTYAVTWDADEAVFTVDGQEVRRCAGPPSYDLQLMVAVFDFPAWSTDAELEPELVVDWVRTG